MIWEMCKWRIQKFERSKQGVLRAGDVQLVNRRLTMSLIGSSQIG